MSARIDVKYQRGPETVLSTQYGSFRAVFSAADYVFCTITDATGRQAHINDHVDGFVFRGQEYIGHVGLYRGEDGTYAVGEHRSHFSKRPQWTDAPPTHQAAMVAAIATAVGEHVKAEPDTLRVAALRKAGNELTDAYKAQDEAARIMAAAKRRVAELEATHRTLSDGAE